MSKEKEPTVIFNISCKGDDIDGHIKGNIKEVVVMLLFTMLSNQEAATIITLSAKAYQYELNKKQHEQN